MSSVEQTGASGACPVVVDLGYGDAGKGAMVDRLVAASRAEVVVRFNGGAQAAHTVCAEGVEHTFAQFGAGTLAGAATHLSRHHLLEPLALAGEAAVLARLGVEDPLSRVSVSPESTLTTPIHRALNRARERARGAGAHGSCGIGIGESVRWSRERPETRLSAGECHSRAHVLEVLERGMELLEESGLRAHLRREDAPELADLAGLADAYLAFSERVEIVGEERWGRAIRAGRAVFEGAQGVLLDQDWGFHPHTTWSSTTSANAEALIAQQGGTAWRVGVIRGYGCRHGAGPMPGEDAELARWFPELHNGVGPWQGAFRVGHLDLVSLRWAMEVQGGIETLAVTHLDRVERALEEAPGVLGVVTAHRGPGERRERVVLAGPEAREEQARASAWLGQAEAEIQSLEEVGVSTGSEWAEWVAAHLGVGLGVGGWGPVREQAQTVSRMSV